MAPLRCTSSALSLSRPSRGVVYFSPRRHPPTAVDDMLCIISHNHRIHHRTTRMVRVPSLQRHASTVSLSRTSLTSATRVKVCSQHMNWTELEYNRPIYSELKFWTYAFQSECSQRTNWPSTNRHSFAAANQISTCKLLLSKRFV